MRFLVLIIWLTSSSIIYHRVHPKGVFGVKIAFQANGELLTFIAYQVHSGKTFNKRIISKDLFIKYASGYWPNPYNPMRINYFKENELFCGCLKDSISKKEFIFCDPLDSLWKIRFASYPFQGKVEEGWSQDQFRPSNNQLKFLNERYGIETIDGDFFKDSSLWQLLKDVQNEKWIATYQTTW